MERKRPEILPKIPYKISKQAQVYPAPRFAQRVREMTAKMDGAPISLEFIFMGGIFSGLTIVLSKDRHWGNSEATGQKSCKTVRCDTSLYPAVEDFSVDFQSGSFSTSSNISCSFDSQNLGQKKGLAQMYPVLRGKTEHTV
jgi:hypothetical protein